MQIIIKATYRTQRYGSCSGTTEERIHLADDYIVTGPRPIFKVTISAVGKLRNVVMLYRDYYIEPHSVHNVSTVHIAGVGQLRDVVILQITKCNVYTTSTAMQNLLYDG